METAQTYCVSAAVNQAIMRCDVSLVGDPGVGKTSLALSFDHRPFVDLRTATVGLDIVTRRSRARDGQRIVYNVWDTAGQERYRAMLPSLIRNCDAIALVYDVGKRETFDNVNKWLHFINNNLPQDAPTILVGNKVDLHNTRKVSYEEGLHRAQKSNLLFLETSAKTGEMVTEVFQQLSTILRDRRLGEVFHGHRVPLSHHSLSGAWPGEDEGRSKPTCCS